MKQHISFDELIEGISADLLQSPRGPTAILAGHQILSSDGQYSKVLGIFPEATWEMAWRIVDAVKESMRIEVFTIINDWAELRPFPNSSEEIREEYWSNPANELKELNNPKYAQHILPAIRFGGQKVQGRFSEKALQNKFSREFGVTQESLTGNSCEDRCASEVVMLARELYKQRIRRLIAFMPNFCAKPITAACNALKQGDYPLEDSGQKDGFTIENFYLNSFKPQTVSDLLLECFQQKIEIAPTSTS